jgi:hypothetical protein
MVARMSPKRTDYLLGFVLVFTLGFVLGFVHGGGATRRDLSWRAHAGTPPRQAPASYRTLAIGETGSPPLDTEVDPGRNFQSCAPLVTSLGVSPGSAKPVWFATSQLFRSIACQLRSRRNDTPDIRYLPDFALTLQTALYLGSSTSRRQRFLAVARATSAFCVHVPTKSIVA